MKYQVIVTPEAQANIAAAHDYIARQNPVNAARFLQRLLKQIGGLEQFPHRFGKAREQNHFAEELRQLVFKPFRIIFTIHDDSRSVHVVYVRHGKMRALGEPNERGD